MFSSSLKSNSQSKNRQFLWRKLLTGTVAVGGIFATLSSGVIATTNPPAMMLAQLTHEELNDHEYWSSLCLLQLDADMLDEATNSCEQAIALKDKQAPYWALYSEVLLAKKDYPGAIATADQALLIEEDNSLALANQCKAFYKLDNLEKALDLCNQALKKNASWGTRSPVIAWELRGILLNLQGEKERDIAAKLGEFYDQLEFEQSLTAFDRAILLEPEHSILHAHRAAVLINLGQYDEAIAATRQAIRLDQEWGDENAALAWYLKGEAHTALREYQQAIAAYDQAISIDPNDYRIWTAQGRIIQILGNLEEALTSFTQAVTLKEDHSKALVQQCKIFNQLKQHDMALPACEAAIAGDGDWWEEGIAEAWNQKAYALAGQGTFEDAFAAVNRAVGIRPHYAEAWNSRAVILWYLKRYPEAIASTEEALRLDPDYARAQATQGSILRIVEQYQASLNAYDIAILKYEKFIKENPQHSPERTRNSLAKVWANKSLVLWHLKSYSEGIDAADASLRLNSNLFSAWMNRAASLMAINEQQEALSSYNQAIQINPESADAWTGLGVALLNLERLDESIEALQKALSFNPEQPLAIAQMEQATLLKAKQAEEMGDQAAADAP